MSCLAQPDLIVQQLPGMIQRGLGDFFPAQHSGNLPVAIFFFKWLDGRQGSTVRDMFRDAEMMLSEFGYLRQVGNAYYLVMTGKL